MATTRYFVLHAYYFWSSFFFLLLLLFFDRSLFLHVSQFERSRRGFFFYNVMRINNCIADKTVIFNFTKSNPFISIQVRSS